MPSMQSKAKLYEHNEGAKNVVKNIFSRGRRGHIDTKHHKVRNAIDGEIPLLVDSVKSESSTGTHESSHWILGLSRGT